jgi:hypothetical protein
MLAAVVPSVNGKWEVKDSFDSTIPQKSVINLYPYIERLGDIIRKYRRSYGTYRFDVIFAAQTGQKGAFLEYIADTGLASDIFDSYKILGTGNIVANAFLKSMWSKNMTMHDFGELCFFIIKYFDKFEIDYTIGLGDKKPQIWFIPDSGDVAQAEELTLNKYETNCDKIFENLRRYGIKMMMKPLNDH